MNMDWILHGAGGAIAALVLSAAARALPDPISGGSRFYLWFFRFSQILLANLDLSAKVEGK